MMGSSCSFFIEVCFFNGWLTFQYNSFGFFIYKTSRRLRCKIGVEPDLFLHVRKDKYYPEIRKAKTNFLLRECMIFKFKTDSK